MKLGANLSKRKFKRKIKVDESAPEETPIEGDDLKADEIQQDAKGGAKASPSSEFKEGKGQSVKDSVKDIELESEEVVDSPEGDGDELAVAKREAAENLDKFLRTAAELENIKKRNIKERQELIKYAGENLARDMLDVADGLELALNQENKGSLEEFVKGVELIRTQLQSVLERHQIKAESLLGKDFQPEKAEALATIPTEGKKVGKILEEFKKAYHFKDKLLRPAQVVVGKEAEKEEKVSEDQDSAEKDKEE